MQVKNDNWDPYFTLCNLWSGEVGQTGILVLFVSFGDESPFAGFCSGLFLSDR